jgi:hypothetical protein
MIDVYAAEDTFADKHALAQNLAAAVMTHSRLRFPASSSSDD